jgi:hypothetical protein
MLLLFFLDAAKDSVEKRACLKIKTDIHKLVEKVFSFSNGSDNDNNDQLYVLLRTIMNDYQSLYTNSDPTVLDMMAMILRKSQVREPQHMVEFTSHYFSM